MSTGLLGAVVAGVLLGASFFDFRLFALAWIGAAVLVAVLAGRTPRRAFLLGFVAGMAGLTLAFAWLIYALQVFGGFPFVIAVIFSLVPIAWMAAQLGLFGALLAWLGPLPFGLAAPLVFTGVEFLFPSLFPWRLAHSQYHLPVLLQSGDLTGPFLLTFAIVWMGACVIGARDLLRREDARKGRAVLLHILPPLLLVGALVVYGQARIAVIEAARRQAPALRVGIVQGNVGVARKGRQASFTRNMQDYRDLSAAIAPASDVLIWPETVFQRHIPTTMRTLDVGYHPFPDAPRPLIFGGLGVARELRPRRIFNSAFLVDVGGQVRGRYDKRVLVPFGEYMPLGDRFPRLRELSPATGHFHSGTGSPLLTLDDNARFGTLICYEDVLPGPARAAVRAGATLLLNLTNDAWYGDTAQPHQHQALAIWRAIETRRDFLRVTNTGLTSVIAASGAVVTTFPTFAPHAEATEVRLLESITPYARYGDLFGWSVVGFLALALAARWRRGRPLPCNAHGPD